MALQFARTLVAGDYTAAHQMLSASLGGVLSAARLKDKFEGMIEYGDGPPDSVDVITVLEEWPAKRSADVGWAYAAIGGDGYSEAVAVVVAEEEGKPVIREVEWGRP